VCWVQIGVHLWTLYVTRMVNSALSIDSKKKLDDFFLLIYCLILLLSIMTNICYLICRAKRHEEIA